MGANNNKGLIESNQNDEGSECLPAGLCEGEGTTTISSVKSVNPASKAFFAERCRELKASHDTTLLDCCCDDEIANSSEPSDTSPLLPRSPAKLLGDNYQITPTGLLGGNSQLRPPSKLLGYDGKRRPAALLGYDGKKSPAAEFYGDDGRLKSPGELLGYDGKKRSPVDRLTHDEKLDYHAELLRADIRDGRKSRPPPGTWARIKKRKAVNSQKSDSGTTGTSGVFNEEKANRNDVLEFSTAEPNLSSPTSDGPEQSKFTQGSLEIEVKFPRGIHP